jgi:cell filamentation protein
MADQVDIAIWAANWEMMFYPGTQILKNHGGFKTKEDLGKLKIFETDRYMAAELGMERNPVKGSFDLQHMQGIHLRLFEKVYPFAGQVRECQIGKLGLDQITMTRFANPDEIPAMAEKLKQQVSAVIELKNVDFVRRPQEAKEFFVDRLASVYQTANQMHPFREGNGRTQRIFLNQLAQEVNYTLDFNRVDSRAWKYAAATSATATLGDVTIEPKTDKLKQVFTQTAIHQREMSNPYIVGKLGPMASNPSKVLEIGDLSPVFTNSRKISL